MRLRWTEAAVHDLTRICDYIQEHASGAVAQRVALAIYQHISSLSHHPHRGRTGRTLGTRELVIAGLPYIVVYRLREKAIEVIRILHGAQDRP